MSRRQSGAVGVWPLIQIQAIGKCPRLREELSQWEVWVSGQVQKGVGSQEQGGGLSDQPEVVPEPKGSAEPR